jgi:DNA mismatch endonuclease, patch repair protein
MAASTRAAPSRPEVSIRVQRVQEMNATAKSALRRDLHVLGLRVRIHALILTRPNRVTAVALVGPRVDDRPLYGCLQHAMSPKSNTDLWRKKLLTHQKCKCDTDVCLRADVWEVPRVWIHETPAKEASLIAKVVQKRNAKEHT